MRFALLEHRQNQVIFHPVLGAFCVGKLREGEQPSPEDPLALSLGGLRLKSSAREDRGWACGAVCANHTFKEPTDIEARDHPSDGEGPGRWGIRTVGGLLLLRSGWGRRGY